VLRNCAQTPIADGDCDDGIEVKLRICARVNGIVVTGSMGSTPRTYLTTRRFEGAAGGVGAVAAAWFTLIATPPTLNTAEREFVPVFAAIVYVAVPEPVRDPVIVAHVAFDDVDHEQLEEVVTVIVPLAPEGGALIDVGDRENVHGAAAWVIVNVRPPIVIVPVRDDVLVFAATL
jgi:hypothetical protein